MCLLLFAYRADAEFPLVVAANRDEYHRRPAAPASWWHDAPILAGRDLEAGGTWFGVNREGQFAAVTNFRDPSSRVAGTRSRGELVVDTLLTKQAGLSWLDALWARRELYNGFNLVFGGRDGVFSFSNRSQEPRELEPGIYGLSNHLLETPWPKVVRGKEKLAACLSAHQSLSTNTLLDLLYDRSAPLDEHLPRTGVSLEWERLLSPMFIVSADYGTRASTAVIVDRYGQVQFAERAFDAAGSVVSQRDLKFQIASS